jgi:hypothetical protein
MMAALMSFVKVTPSHFHTSRCRWGDYLGGVRLFNLCQHGCHGITELCRKVVNNITLLINHEKKLCLKVVNKVTLLINNGNEFIHFTCKLLILGVNLGGELHHT